MKVIIDANRVIASMIKEGTTREILFDSMFEFSAPDNIMSEIRKHEKRVTEAAQLTKEEFEVLLILIFENIKIIPKADYQAFMEENKSKIKDPEDLPYIAVCLATGSEGIWTHDPHFKEQKIVETFTNIDMLRKAGKVKAD